jgi:hypothetical protein
MEDLFKYIEGRMDESSLYGIIVKNVVKSLFILVGILLFGWFICNILIPSAQSSWLMFIVSCCVTIFVFQYVFKPSGWYDRSVWVIGACLYSAVMYISGQSIVLSIITFGTILTIFLLFGESIFTGIFTYRDLKEWVRKDLERQKSQPIVDGICDSEKIGDNESD